MGGGERVLLSAMCAACNWNVHEGNDVRSALQGRCQGNSNTKLCN